MYFWLKPTKKTLKKVEKMVFGQPWPTVQSFDLISEVKETYEM